MEASNIKAWEYLTDKEKNSLYLQLTKGLSTWEAGEVLEITHYKYIELKDRAVKFLNLYTLYFEVYESFFRADAPVDNVFRDYIEACLEKRLDRKQAIEYCGDSEMNSTHNISGKIIKNMERLKESGNKHDKDLYDFINEFDRWNNFRILPRKIQQPSAYKRRNNKRDKYYIKYICNLPENRVRRLIDTYWYSPKRKKARYFIALISEEIFEEGYGIIPIKAKPKQVKELSDMFIYIFEDETRADIFGYQVSRYKTNINNSKTGFEFWNEYRTNLKEAINYNEVNNLDFYAENLDMAYDVKSRKRNHKKPKKENFGAPRADEAKFY